MRAEHSSEAAAMTRAAATASAASAAPAAAAAPAVAPAACSCAQRSKEGGGRGQISTARTDLALVFLAFLGGKGADKDVDGQVRGPGEVDGHEHDGHEHGIEPASGRVKI